MSGDNPEYLTGQQIKAVPYIKKTALEVVPTAYILIDGGQASAVERISKTKPISQADIERITHICIAAEYSGKKLIYLEAGSGAKYHVSEAIIRQVKQNIRIPLVVGGGIRTESQKQSIYDAGADLIVMGTVFENT
jgi:putative glycerol-1-phosphate prenyltransferase